jgi:lysosomal alpha-mannosidase
MEFVWRPMYDSLGDSVQIFSSALYAMYWAPPNFGFDTLDTDDPFIVDEKLTTYNAPEKAQEFHKWIINQKQYYRSNNIIVPMGADFNFQNAPMNFASTGALIEYYNEHIGKEYNIELIYSTPSMYIDSVFEDNLVWSTKYDDMFPYANNDVSYWTGYFSSRANDKEYIRRA